MIRRITVKRTVHTVENPDFALAVAKAQSLVPSHFEGSNLHVAIQMSYAWGPPRPHAIPMWTVVLVIEESTSVDQYEGAG